MNKQPIVSVIVPVYNVEKYLNRCMESLVNQTENNIEIILIDDGSKDSSGLMCDEWEKKDSRVRVIHKKNEGLGFARNSGIKIAKGEYIAYVDSDDYLETVALEKVVARLRETNADICYFGCVDVWEDKKRYGVVPDKLIYSSGENIEYVKNILGPPATSTEFLFGGVSAWSGIVKRELIIRHNILFPSERECLCEDIFYNLQVCMNSEIIAIEPTCLYCYCHNDNNSLTLRYREDRFEAAIKMNHKLREIMREKGLLELTEERLLRSLMQNLIVCVKQEVNYSNKIGKRKSYRRIKEICNHVTVKETLANYPINKMPIKQRILFSLMHWKNVMGIILITKVKQNCM